VKNIRVVSLFDGISCGRIALERAGYTVSSYAAFEIDKYARAISRRNFPDTTHYGDVFDADFKKFAGYDLVIGGSPCTFWSIAKANREVDKNGRGWKLFMRFLEAVRQIEPRFFLLENVASMPEAIKHYISDELGYTPILINSALVSAQHRKRFYWTNITGITQPANKGILLKDILQSGIPYQEKSHCLTASYSSAVFWNSLERKQRSMIAEPVSVGAALRTRADENGSFKRLEVRGDGKLNALTTVQTDSVICLPVRIGVIGNGGQGERIYSVRGKTVSMKSRGGGGGALTGLYKIDLPDGDYTVRKLTPVEAERCQTIPDMYTTLGIDDNGNVVKISNTQRYRTIGNAFTVDVIAHILSFVR
jgi:DNA (cytosine-5)-methyltransferase 3A